MKAWREILAAAAFAAPMLAAGCAMANMAPPVHEFHAGLTVACTRDGLKISTLEKDGAAQRAGVQIGDLVLAVDGRWFRAMSAADIKAFAEDIHGWPIHLILVRGRQSVEAVDVKH